MIAAPLEINKSRRKILLLLFFFLLSVDAGQKRPSNDLWRPGRVQPVGVIWG